MIPTGNSSAGFKSAVLSGGQAQIPGTNIGITMRRKRAALGQPAAPSNAWRSSAPHSFGFGRPWLNNCGPSKAFGLLRARSASKAACSVTSACTAQRNFAHHVSTAVVATVGAKHRPITHSTPPSNQPLLPSHGASAPVVTRTSTKAAVVPPSQTVSRPACAKGGSATAATTAARCAAICVSSASMLGAVSDDSDIILVMSGQAFAAMSMLSAAHCVYGVWCSQGLFETRKIRKG